MNFQNKIAQKLISFFIIIGIIAPALFVFSTPQKAIAVVGVEDTNVADVPSLWSQIFQNVKTAAIAVYDRLGSQADITNTSYTIKNWGELIAKQALMAVARKALQKMTQSTINWINNGFHGSPLFVQNPDSFFRDIAKSEVKNMVDTFGYDALRFPFGRDFALNTINSYKRTLENNATSSYYNMSQDPVVLYNLRNNFNYGGWNAFIINTQYPQNNYLGFQMLATDQLALKLQGTSQNAAQKVQTALQQGQGFLGPQKCATNPNYDNSTNEFNKPPFDVAQWEKDHPLNLPDCSEDPSNIACINAYTAAQNKWNGDLASAKDAWMKKNTCPGGLTGTTPGAVVSNQIMKAMSTSQDSTLQAMGLGNDISAVFDALINKFVGDGLSALATTTNPPPATDTWTYGGQSLESTSNNSSALYGPDGNLSLDEFKRKIAGADVGTCSNIVDSMGVKTADQYDIPKEDCTIYSSEAKWTKTGHTEGDIDRTKEELALMDNPPCDPNDIVNCPSSNLSNPNNPAYAPGMVQAVAPAQKAARDLDVCLPGPDKNWEIRLNGEYELAKMKFSDPTNDNNDITRAKNDVLNELNFAVTSFKDWVNIKMMNSLPSAILYMDNVKGIENYSQQLTELANKKTVKIQTLSRLNAIKNSLVVFSTQPKIGSIEEKSLITLKKQYDAIKSNISSEVSIEDSRNLLNTLKNQLADSLELNKKCLTERKAAGWNDPDFTGFGNQSKLNGLSETETFCSKPISSGYSHGNLAIPYDWRIGIPGTPAGTPDPSGYKFTFRNESNEKGAPGYEDLPLVNAKWVFGNLICTGVCSWPDLGAVKFGSLGEVNLFGPMGDALNKEKNKPEDKRISVDLNCSTIFKASPLDYLKSGDSTY